MVCTVCDEVNGEEYEVVADGWITVAQPPCEADARLIAAAPKMLAELQWLKDMLLPLYGLTKCGAYGRICNVIAEATGESAEQPQGGN
jgi:hypothetical protein